MITYTNTWASAAETLLKYEKNCLEIHLFSLPESLVMRHATTAARNVVSFLTLIGPFEFECTLTTRPSPEGNVHFVANQVFQ